MPLDFKENGVHLIDVDHGLENFVHVFEIKLNRLIEEVSIKVEGSVGWDVFEFAFDDELLGPCDFSVVGDVFMEKRGCFEYFIGEEFH